MLSAAERAEREYAAAAAAYVQTPADIVAQARGVQDLSLIHISDDCPRTAGIGHGGAEPGLGGMAHGLPERMDGRILWEREPDGVPRMTERMDERALRLKTLGNAVCPPQAYPIFRYIAAIETGACVDICPYGKDGDCL